MYEPLGLKDAPEGWRIGDAIPAGYESSELTAATLEALAQNAFDQVRSTEERMAVALLATSLLVGDVLVHPVSGAPRYATMAWPDGSLGTYIAKALSGAQSQYVDAYTVSYRPHAAPHGLTAWRPTSGFAPLSDAVAASRVVRVPEVVSANQAHASDYPSGRNAYVPSDGELAAYVAARPALDVDPTENPYNRYVTGRPGISNPTTDELIQWASHKWGIPTDRVRAQMHLESKWSMDFLGDLTTQPDQAHYDAAPDYAKVPSTLNVYESLGISQLRWFPDKVGNSNPHPGTEPLRWKSTAFNLDYYGSVVRFYFDDPDGRRTAWGDGTYAAGDEWLSQGGWFLPYPWNNVSQQGYVANVQVRLAARPWVVAEFSDVVADIVLLTQAAISRSQNGSVISRPPIVEGPYESPDPPGAPTGVTAVAGNASVTLDWTAPTDDGGAPIARYRMTNVQFGWSVDTDYEAQHPYTLTGLTNGDPVSFTVEAIGVTGLVGPPSSASSLVTPTAPTVPGAPTGVGGTAGNALVHLSWTAPASDGGSAITNYLVRPFIAGVEQATVNTGSSATGFTVTGLVNGTAYTFKVAAENVVGNGADSSASGSLTPEPPPDFVVPDESPLVSDGLAVATSNEDFRPATNLITPMLPAPGSRDLLTWRSVAVPTTGAPQWGAIKISTLGSSRAGLWLQLHGMGQPRYTAATVEGTSYPLGSNSSSVYTTLMEDYRIRVHPSTGACPADGDSGWIDVFTVTGNRRTVPVHVLPDLSSYGWIQCRVTASSGVPGNDDLAFRMDLWDVSSTGGHDSILWYGDSISMESNGLIDAGTNVWSDGGMAHALATASGRSRPIFADFSTGGWTAHLGRTYMTDYLGGMPHKIWVIAFGHNDAHNANVDLSTIGGTTSTYALNYKSDYQAMIDYAATQGAERVIAPVIMWTSNSTDETNVGILNEILSDLADENPGYFQLGADLHAFFAAHQSELRDGIHPTIPAGYLDYHSQQASWFNSNVYS